MKDTGQRKQARAADKYRSVYNMDEQLYHSVENMVEDIAILHTAYGTTLSKIEIIELSKVAVLQEVLAELEKIKNSLDNIYNEI